MTSQFVAYHRVSTAKQGASGLGLAAQRQAVREHVARHGGELIGEFEEVESGKRSDRPALAQAMERCRLTGSTLLIAKLDRLSRNVHFLSGLMEQGVDFIACDMPSANKLTVHIMAAVAQQEREAISTRTKAALGSIRLKLANGEVHVSSRSGRTLVRLGNPQGLKDRRPDLGTAAKRKKATAFALGVMPTIRKIQAEGAVSLAAIASKLNEKRVRAARGGEWTPMSVKRVLDRSGAGSPSQ
ncbi:recombinase family protein [Phenylobacterium sp.]|uniref:recombinase family protein n=1 Tax=Phenylobacterium sp. TaxID=1871053 RepID=UPI00273488D3|nr:recombinase family protein [Phenylobacterium sp.]MDP3634111.1 recombinase family protein [Phenylobacterium sp.]